MPRRSKQSAARKENLKKAQLACIAARQHRKKPMEPSISGQGQNLPLAKETVPDVRDGEPEATIGALGMELMQERSNNPTKLL